MKKKIMIVVLSALLISAAPVLAETGVKELQQNLGNFGGQTGLGTAGDSDLKGKIASILNIVLGFLGIIAVIMIIVAGFKWMTAGGNEEAVKQARSRITNAAIGLLVVLASYIIVNFTVTYLSRATGGGGGDGAGTERSGETDDEDGGGGLSI